MGDRLTEKQAARAMKISLRTLQRKTSDGDDDVPYSELVPRPGKKPARMYDADQVEAWVAKKRPVQVLRRGDPRLPAPGLPSPSLPTPVAAAVPVVASAFEKMGRQIADALRPRPEGVKDWLKIEAAAEYMGMPEALLRLAIKFGEIPAVKFGSWYVRRVDCDNCDTVAVLAALAKLKAATERLRAQVKVRKAAGK